jgi:hypothetical protein
MHNFFWFLLLIIFSVLLFTYTIWNKRNPKIIIIYLVMIGLAFIFEYVILVIFDAYVYSPNIIKDDYFDNMLGAIISQALIIPTFIVFFSAFRFKYRYIFLFVLMFAGIEEFFLWLDIYKHNWWRTPFTSIILIFTFILCDVWFSFTKYTSSLKTKKINLFFSILSVNNLFIFFMVLLFETYLYQLGWFENTSRDHITGNGIYLFFLSVFMTYVILNYSIYSVTFFLLCEYITELILIDMDILVLGDWHPIFFSILALLSLTGYRVIYLKWIKPYSFRYY